MKQLRKLGQAIKFLVLSVFLVSAVVVPANAAQITTTKSVTVYDSPSGGNPVVFSAQTFNARQQWFLVSTSIGNKWIGFNEDQFGNVVFNGTSLTLRYRVTLLNSPSNDTPAGYLDPQTITVKQEWFLIDTTYGMKFLGFNAPCPVLSANNKPWTINLTATKTNLYATPSWNQQLKTSSGALAYLGPQAGVKVLSQQGDWYKISTYAGYAWVNPKYPTAPPTTSERDAIIKRAEDMVYFSWTSPASFPQWNSSYWFTKSITYQGMPYTMSCYQMRSSSEFKNKIINNSPYLTFKGYIGGGYRIGPKYGNDCSGFVSAAWNIPRQTTSTISTYSYSIAYGELLKGDALNKAGSHIVLFLGWYDSAHTKMYVYEQTPPKAKKSLYSVIYLQTNGYKAIRYNGFK